MSYLVRGGKYITAGGQYLTAGPLVFMYGWGYNYVNSIFSNSPVTSMPFSSIYVTPFLLPSYNWNFMSPGDVHTVALDVNGKMWAAGWNWLGQCGVDNDYWDVEYPTLISQDTWKTCSAGSWYSAAIKNDGTLWTWGEDSQVGRGLISAQGTKNWEILQVGSDTDWDYIFCSNNVGYALKTNGELWVWGGSSSISPHLGLGDVSMAYSITKVGSATWDTVSGSSRHALGIQTNGTLWAWGENAWGKTGLDVSTGNTTTPTQIGSQTDWAQVAAGLDHSLARKNNGTIWGWGDNREGYVGQGPSGETYYMTPIQIGTDSDWIDIKAGFEYSIAKKTDGTLWTWGSNNRGQTGQDTSTGFINVPTQLGSDSWSAFFVKGNSQTSFARKNNVVEEPYVPTVYGYLYNHYAVRDSSLIYASGWAVPTETFTNTLISYINTDQGDTSTGIHLKSCRTVDNPAGGDCSTSIHPRWDDPTTAFPPATFAVAGIDSYNFSSVPGGVRYNTGGSGFSEIGIEGPFWLFDTTGSNGKSLNMSFNSHVATIADYSQGYGQAIRLARSATSGEQSSLANGDYADDYVGNDGRRYKTVRIGTQIWMAENLAETKYRDGTPIPTVTDQTTWDSLTTGAKCVYDNNSIYL